MHVYFIFRELHGREYIWQHLRKWICTPQTVPWRKLLPKTKVIQSCVAFRLFSLALSLPLFLSSVFIFVCSALCHFIFVYRLFAFMDFTMSTFHLYFSACIVLHPAYFHILLVISFRFIFLCSVFFFSSTKRKDKNIEVDSVTEKVVAILGLQWKSSCSKIRANPLINPLEMCIWNSKSSNHIWLVSNKKKLMRIFEFLFENGYRNILSTSFPFHYHTSLAPPDYFHVRTRYLCILYSTKTHLPPASFCFTVCQ